MKQSILIFSAIVLGVILPQGHLMTGLIKYTLMMMLFLAFLGIPFHWKMFRRSHLIITLANLLLPVIFYLVLLPFGNTLALTAFVCSIPPTAAAAPVLAQFMHTDVSYVTASVMTTNPLVAIFIPLVLPLLMPVEQMIAIPEVLFPVFEVVGIPLLLASFTKKFSPAITTKLLRFNMMAFYLFLLNVWIACGNATHFVRNHGAEHQGLLITIFLVTTVLCIVTFRIGEWIGPKDERMAGSLALGRKNTMFGLWLALTFVSPLVALGPICYILIQNAYNSYQILMIERYDRRINPDKAV